MAITTTSQNNTKSIAVGEVEVATVNYTTDKNGGLAFNLNITNAKDFHATKEATENVNAVLAEAIETSQQNLPVEVSEAE